MKDGGSVGKSSTVRIKEEDDADSYSFLRGSSESNFGDVTPHGVCYLYSYPEIILIIDIGLQF